MLAIMNQVNNICEFDQTRQQYCGGGWGSEGDGGEIVVGTEALVDIYVKDTFNFYYIPY